MHALFQPNRYLASFVAKYSRLRISRAVVFWSIRGTSCCQLPRSFRRWRWHCATFAWTMFWTSCRIVGAAVWLFVRRGFRTATLHSSFIESNLRRTVDGDALTPECSFHSFAISCDGVVRFFFEFLLKLGRHVELKRAGVYCSQFPEITIRHTWPEKLVSQLNWSP